MSSGKSSKGGEVFKKGPGNWATKNPHLVPRQSGTDLRDFAAQFESLAATIEGVSVELMRGILEDEIVQAAAESRNVDGSAWPVPNNGHTTMDSFTSDLTVVTVGNAVVVRLGGHHVWHEWGSGVPKRSTLPTGGMPDKVGNAFALGIADVYSWGGRQGS